MPKLIFATRWFPSALLVTYLWAAPPPTTAVRKPAIASLADPHSPRLLRISAISPLRFEPNVGQAGPGVRYIARGTGYMMMLTGQEAVMALPSGSSSSALVHMKLVGAANTSASQPENPLPSLSHYYIGDDPNKWHPNVPNYERVKFEQVYPGIDLVYYGNQQRLEYDFVLQPGAEPNQIRLAYSGADSMRLDSDGDLILNVQGRELRQRRPVVYQEIGGKRVELAGGYELTKRTGEVRFAVARYDRAKPLIVDPVLVYSTYLGGTVKDLAYAMAADSTGAAYVTGLTSGAFPTLNAEQNTFGGGNSDAFVAKLSPSGALVYSTYLGGAGGDQGLGIAVDSTGAAYVTGSTGGAFPTLNAQQNTFGGGGDAFVAKLDPTGALVYSTYLGGTSPDSGNGIGVDSAGAAYVTGSTQGAFPTLNAQQNTFGGTQDAFVAKLSPTGALVYSTYLGGTGSDSGNGIGVDNLGAAYVTGLSTGSFPTLNAEQNTFGGGSYDAFVAKLSPTGALVYSTYLGGTGLDVGYGIGVDGTGAAYVTGSTNGGFPTLNAVQNTFGGTGDAFIAKLGPTGALVYSTYLGGTGNDQGSAIAVDSAGATFVSGYTSGGFPTLNAVQNTYGGGAYDAFVAKLNSSGALVYSTYLGGTGIDLGIGIAIDGNGAAYVAGATSGNFPTLNAIQGTYGGGSNSAFIAKLSGNPVNLVSLNPNTALAGSTSLNLRVNGTGFSNGSTVLWNGSPLSTTFVSPTQLTATVTAALLNSAGSATVAVGNSISLTFTFLPPAVNSLSPQSIGPGSPSFTLTVGGSNFVPASTVQWNGANLTTSFVSSSQLTAMVPANLVMATGTASVKVLSANSPSNALTFIIGTPDFFACVFNSGNPVILRQEASTELQGDLFGQCSGGTLGQTLTSDITVTANVNLTSRILNAGTQATEALLLIDDPAPAQQVLGTNVFQGTLTAPNSITFRSVPIMQPGNGARFLRITNLRGYVAQFQQLSNNLIPDIVSAILSMSGPVALSSSQQTTGFVQLATIFRLGSTVGSLADQRTVQVSFREGFASAFKLRVAPGGQQNIPGYAYNTESGFVNTALLPAAGLADSATRLMVLFSGVPAGANVYAPIFPDGNTNAQLVATDSNGAGPTSFIQGTSMFGGKYAQVTITNGSGIAVWEVTAADPTVNETLQFHIVLTGMTQPGVGPIGLGGSLAPLSNVSTASATDPVPRVAVDSVTRFVNLTLTSNSTASTGVGALALPGVRPSELQRTIRTQSTPSVQVGSTLSFTYGLINNGPGPAPNVTVQSNLPSTLSFLDCSTSTGGACSAATNPDGSITVTGVYGSLQPGQSQYFVIHGQPLNGALGTNVSVSTLVSSGMEDSYPGDNAFITMFGVVSTAVTVPVSFPSNPARLKVQVGMSAAQVNPTVMVDQAVPFNFTAPSPQADPLGAPGKQYVFNSWSDGSQSAAHTSVTPPIGGGTYTANFDAQFQIAATAAPAAGGTVSVAPSAANNFYTAYAPVMLTATPASGYIFTGFTGDVTSGANPLSMLMPAAPLNIRANFAASVFTASPSAVQFGVTPGGALITSQQTINVQAPPGVAWSASANQNFISVSPTSGTGNGSFTIGIVASALPTSGTASGMVILTAPNISTSPMVNVTAAIGPSTKPFGAFDTPVDGMTNVVGAIPVTGWALDSIEVLKVDIWREPVPNESTASNGLVYIGDAVFVFGARPDVQAANPGLPLNTRGGWGYQMLTNFLPNAAGSGPSGNGIYKLHAIAHNKAGVSVDLGTKTITVDNTDAAKPFGTIDTPGQGGTASGNAYLNFGWALTPKPNIIPVDGSTITVVVDGVLVGHPTYGNYRSDIANLFPGYKNSGGAVGFYYIDTTALANGVHTISWNVYDDGGHGEGIGSRYFNVFNSGGPVAAPEEGAMEPATITGADAVEIEEVGHIKLPLGAIKGYQLVGGERVPLPIGSSLKRGVLYWQPGPGFLGDYTLVFERPDGTEAQVRVTIHPKKYAH
jgi:uncharacterized repeat protein (TIGR01451 family)